MKRKLTYFLGLLLIASAVWADDCMVTYKAFHGPHGQPYAMQETNAFFTVNPTQTHNSFLPSTPKGGLTSYSIDAGRVEDNDPISSSAAQFTYIPTQQKPYLLIWFSIELYCALGVHEPLLGKISITNANGDPIGCVYSFNGDSIAANPNAFGYLRGEAWSASLWRTSMSKYRPWDIMCIDLSNYVGENVFIYAEANTCTTQSCSSVIYLAFENLSTDSSTSELCYSCDSASIKAPGGYNKYTWHKGSPTGPVVGTDSILTVQGKWNITNYYCTVSGYCGELTYVAPVQDVRSVFNYDLHCGVGNAKDTVYFTNTSFKQKRIAPYTMEECDAFYWDFGNGQTSTQRAPGYVLYDKGKQVTVRLRTGTEDFACDAWSDVTFRTCDKEDSIPLNPMPNVPVTDSIDSIVCHGTIVEWHDMYLTETGIYRDTLLSKTWGTDSIYYVLNLTVSAEPVTIPLKDTTSCNLVPFLWRGHQIVSDTICYDTIRTTKIGCDSIYASLLFTTLLPDASEETRVICDRQLPYTWKGISCGAAGDYTFDTLTAQGCDSTITLHLVVKDHAEGDTTAYICHSETFYWHGKVAQDGDTIILINSVGCDSIVTIHLTTSAAPIAQTFDTVVCDTLLPHTWRGRIYEKPIVIKDTLYNARGCDSIYRSFTLDTVHCVRPEPPVPPEPPVDTCVSDLVYRKWVDFIFCDNGKDDFIAFQWYRNNQLLAGETGQYLYLPGTMGAAEYFVEVTKTDGNTIRTCPLIFDNTPRSRDTYVKVQTVIHRGEPLQIAMSDPEADVVIYTMVGQRVLSAHILGPEASLPIALPAGAYILRIEGDQVEATTKILME